MNRLKSFVWGLLLAAPLSAQKAPVRALDSLLQAPMFRTSEVGLTVYDLTADSPLYQHRAQKRSRPASVQKVMTSVAALATLGADHDFYTYIYKVGETRGDTLAGSLTVVGDMDPLFSAQDMDRLAEGVRRGGIRYVRDGWRGDVSMKDSVYWGPGWSWDDAPYAFQPYLSPLMVDEGCVEVTVRPALRDSLPGVEVRPASSFYRVENRAVSHRPAAGKLRVERDWMRGGRTLTVTGNAEKTVTKTLTMGPSQDFFLQLLAEKASAPAGAPCSLTYAAPRSEGREVLASVRRPLTEVLTRALKKSDNLCAEAMFFHVARQAVGESHPLSWEEASTALVAFARDSLGVAADEYEVVDGSGVSLYDYASPEALLAALKWAYRRPQWFRTFYEALPVAGVDGTLAGRMKGTRAEGNVHAKTGSVTGVSTLAGYVTAANGHLLAFVIMNQNVVKLREARQWQDAVCAALAGDEA
jgi:D-alanyl-D-alanine carboxypeptidase/D-alanyl-D-alanine-endopeptidase (penicillin-binding protein 4)